MKATLIYNPNAGLLHTVTADAILNGLMDAGYEPLYRPTSCVDDLPAVLDEAEGLIVVAGGDGTFRAVAVRMVDRGNPLTVLPMGTANNIAWTFGIQGRPLDLVAGLENPDVCSMDLGVVESPWGVYHFLESIGCGLYADIGEAYGPDRGKDIPRLIQTIAETLPNYPGTRVRMTIDGVEVVDDFLLVEALNTKAFGPRLAFAPKAEPDDGLLDVVRIHSDVRKSLADYVQSVVSAPGDLPNVEVTRARQVDIEPAARPFHVDSLIVPAQSPSTSSGREENSAQLLHVRLEPKVFEIWVPQGPAVGAQGRERREGERAG